MIMVEGARDDRRDHPRDGRRHQRHPRAAARLPRRRPRDLRRVRHRDDRRRGDGRLRPLRRVVRRRPLGRRPRPDHLRQGRELRLRPARRRAHQRRDRGDVRRARLPRRAHLLAATRWRAPRPSRRSTSSRRRASSSTPARWAPTSSARSWPSIADRHPSRRRGARARRVLGASSSSAIRETREPLVPYNAAGADAAPMNEFAAACKQRGLWPFTHFNRTHVVPPCTTTEARGARGPGDPRRGARGRRPLRVLTTFGGQVSASDDLPPKVSVQVA